MRRLDNSLGTQTDAFIPRVSTGFSVLGGNYEFWRLPGKNPCSFPISAMLNVEMLNKIHVLHFHLVLTGIHSEDITSTKRHSYIYNVKDYTNKINGIKTQQQVILR